MAPLPDLSRRGLLGALGASVLVAGCGATDNQPDQPRGSVTDAARTTKIVYGRTSPDQYGLLGLPTGTPRGLAILVHGGFWFRQYGADLMEPMAVDLRRRGYATWNIEYRRIGDGGHYPTTFQDVAAAFDKVADLGVPAQVPRVSIGHSAGGHLAVWAASRTARTPGGRATGAVSTTISLSGVLDLASAADTGLGDGAVQELMGSRPVDDPGLYALADPVALVPARGRVVAVHAVDDEIVPRNQSSAYVKLDRAAGGQAELVGVPGGHFDLIDPRSAAWKKIVQYLPGS